jgi:biotin carboxylase
MPRALLLLSLETYRAQDYLAAGRRAGVDILVGTGAPLAFSEENPDRYITLPMDDPEAAAARAREAAGALDAVIAADEDTVVTAAVIAEAVGARHISVAAATRARDKLEMREALTAAGLPQPLFSTWSPGQPLPDVGFPCVVKPARASASRGVIRANDVDELEATLARVAALDGVEPPLIVEAFVPGDEVAVEGLARDGEVDILAIFDKPDPLEGPYFEETLYITPSRHPRAAQDAVARRVRDAARALGVDRGPIHAELRLTGDDAVVIELAARTIGGLCGRTLRFSTGMSLEELVLLEAVGADPSARRQALAAGVMMLPAPRRGVLRGVRGRAEVEATTGIEALEITVGLGQEVVPPPEGRRYLGFLFSRGATAADAERALREAWPKLDIDID